MSKLTDRQAALRAARKALRKVARNLKPAWGEDRSKHYIYILLSPLDCDPFYVGITNNPAKRMRQHQRNSNSAAHPAMRVYSPSMRWHTDAKMVVVAKFE